MDNFLLQDKFKVESRHGRTAGVRALAHYGQALLAMADVEANRLNGSSDLQRELRARAELVHDLIIKEISNGYPSSSGTLFHIALSHQPGQSGK